MCCCWLPSMSLRISDVLLKYPASILGFSKGFLLESLIFPRLFGRDSIGHSTNASAFGYGGLNIISMSGQESSLYSLLLVKRTAGGLKSSVVRCPIKVNWSWFMNWFCIVNLKSRLTSPFNQIIVNIPEGHVSYRIITWILIVYKFYECLYFVYISFSNRQIYYWGYLRVRFLNYWNLNYVENWTVIHKFLVHTSRAFKWSLGPIPDKSRSFADSTTPALTITSLVARTNLVTPCLR